MWFLARLPVGSLVWFQRDDMMRPMRRKTMCIKQNLPPAVDYGGSLQLVCTCVHKRAWVCTPKQGIDLVCK